MQTDAADGGCGGGLDFAPMHAVVPSRGKATSSTDKPPREMALEIRVRSRVRFLTSIYGSKNVTQCMVGVLWQMFFWGGFPRRPFFWAVDLSSEIQNADPQTNLSQFRFHIMYSVVYSHISHWSSCTITGWFVILCERINVCVCASLLLTSSDHVRSQPGREEVSTDTVQPHPNITIVVVT